MSHSGLAHHFTSMEQQRQAGSLGMWVFLVTEIMFFGGLFLAYLIFRSKYGEAFYLGSRELSISLGSFNTLVLIASSLTMALAVHASQRSNRGRQILFLLATVALGVVFLGVKGVEYRDKITHHHFPGSEFSFQSSASGVENGKAGVPSKGGTVSNQIQLFFFLYFSMTGVHAIHMIVGVVVLLFLIYFAYRGRFDSTYHAPVELTGLYWHFVDIVWIYLFPLLYLIGRHE